MTIMTMMANMTMFSLKDSDIAWLVFVDLSILNYLKKLLENIKNGQNGMSDKNENDD